MGLFNKLKNVLFEEEEVEVPVEEPKREKPKEERKVLEKKKNVFEETYPNQDPILSDRDLFKAEKTFDFPVFDDKEFEEMKNTVSETFYEEEPVKKQNSLNIFDFDKQKLKKEKIKSEEIKGRAYEHKTTDFDKRKFKPSPVISPVYGVLDKNYKKEDIIVEHSEKKQIDVDDVRKKAFGTLENDIEKNLKDSTKEKEKEKERLEPITPKEKTIDELLEETAFDSIDLPEYEKENEDDFFDKNDELDVLDQKDEKKEEDKLEENATLENDLFDLIDSMYEEKEEE